MKWISLITSAIFIPCSHGAPINNEIGRWAHLSWYAVPQYVENGKVIYTPDITWVTMDHLVADEISEDDMTYIVTSGDEPVCVSAAPECKVELQYGTCHKLQVVARHESTTRLSVASVLEVCTSNPPEAVLGLKYYF